MKDNPNLLTKKHALIVDMEDKKGSFPLTIYFESRKDRNAFIKWFNACSDVAFWAKMHSMPLSISTHR